MAFYLCYSKSMKEVLLLKAIACSGHGKMKMIRYGTLKTGDLKNDIPDLAHRSWGGFL